MQSNVSVRELVNDLMLELLTKENGLDNVITEDEITSPGLEIAGFYNYFEPARIIMIGSKEATYLLSLAEKAYERIEYLFRHNPPAVVFSRNVSVPDFIIELGYKYHVAILKSELRTTPLNSKLYSYLREKLAERITVHGVLMDINGMGTLIIGKSGIGKSETALELLKRGHQLIADDCVEIYEKEVGVLIGNPPATIAQFLEVRGVGIVNVVEMFGAGAFRENKKIRLVIELEQWNKDKVYDRLGLVNEKETYFHSELPKKTIPVLPGRNTAVLVEAAAMNEKLKYLGYDGALDLTTKIGKIARGEK